MQLVLQILRTVLPSAVLHIAAVLRKRNRIRRRVYKSESMLSVCFCPQPCHSSFVSRLQIGLQFVQIWFVDRAFACINRSKLRVRGFWVDQLRLTVVKSFHSFTGGWMAARLSVLPAWRGGYIESSWYTIQPGMNGMEWLLTETEDCSVMFVLRWKRTRDKYPLVSHFKNQVLNGMQPIAVVFCVCSCTQSDEGGPTERGGKCVLH